MPTYEPWLTHSTDSDVSLRVNHSKGAPPNFNEEKTSEHRTGLRPQSHQHTLVMPTYEPWLTHSTDSDVSLRVNHSKGAPPNFNEEQTSEHREEVPHNRKKDQSRLNKLIEQSEIKCEGSPTLYHLKPKEQILCENPTVKRKTTGQKDTRKTQKTILMVGEVGTGKSTLINAMVNYMLGVKPEDKVWFDITGEEGQNQTESQTRHITVYDVFMKESSDSLTVIDTPGFGDTRGITFDEIVSESLLSLCRMEDGVHEIDAVCLVVKASQNRLSERQHYIFNAVVSLFGKDIEKNIVILITHSGGAHPDALQTITETKIPCALNKKNQPVHFKFDNWQEQSYDGDNKKDYQNAWKRGERSMKNFLGSLSTMEKRSLKMTEGVLRKRKQLKACFNNLLERVKWTELKQEELKQKRDAMEKFRKDDKEFEVEIDEIYKEKVPISPSWWHLSKTATCCTVCEENCHYPGCWWVSNLSWYSVMDEGNCNVCTNKCHYTKHVKEGTIYVSKTRRVKKTAEDLKLQYKKELRENENMVCKLQDEIIKAKEEKIRLIEEAYQSIITLEEFALKPDSYSTLLHLDFVIEKIKETGDMERYQRLIDIKKKADDENKRGMAHFRAMSQTANDMWQVGKN